MNGKIEPTSVLEKQLAENDKGRSDMTEKINEMFLVLILLEHGRLRVLVGSSMMLPMEVKCSYCDRTLCNFICQCWFICFVVGFFN